MCTQSYEHACLVLVDYEGTLVKAEACNKMRPCRVTEAVVKWTSVAIPDLRSPRDSWWGFGLKEQKKMYFSANDQRTDVWFF